MENGRPQREMAVVESGEGATARQNRPADNSSQTAEGDWASQHDRRVKRAPCRNRPSAEAWACGEGAMRCGILEVNLRCSALSTACIIRGIQRGGRCDGSDW
jgi:hypothetical protein